MLSSWIPKGHCEFVASVGCMHLNAHHKTSKMVPLSKNPGWLNYHVVPNMLILLMSVNAAINARGDEMGLAILASPITSRGKLDLMIL